MPTLETVFKAKARAKEILEGLRGINGIGIAQDANRQPCVRVNVEASIDASDRRRIPVEILGVPVQVRTVILDPIDSDA